MITDLTGTTWYINYAPTLSSGYYEINFISRVSSFTSIDILPSSGATDPSVGVINYNNDGETFTQIFAYDSVSWPQCRWSVQYYRGITFTGGSDVTNQSLITWLENNAVQVTIDTLSNTSWLMSEVLESYAGYELYPDTAIGANINFVVANDPSVTYSNLTWSSKTILRYRIGPAADSNYLTAYNSGWVDGAYRAITVIDGSDINSNFLRGWFQTNAVPYVKPIEYVDKTVLLSGDEYYFKDTISGYLSSSDLVAGTNISIEEDSEGKAVISSSSNARVRIIRLPEPVISDLTSTTWYFNNTYSAPPAYKEYSINFTNESNSYTALDFTASTTVSGVTYTDLITYSTGSGTSPVVAVNGDTWDKESYRTITITGGTDVTDPDLIAWFKANATQVS